LKEPKVATQKNNKMTTVRKTTSGKPIVVVAVRRQTLEQQRQFNSALEVLLREMVRQELGREGGEHEQERI
jgi:hypothetical protein